MGEFIEGFDNLADDRQGRHDLRLGAHASRRSAVSGRAGSRAPARRGRLRDHHRRGPGIMEAANKGAKLGGGRSDRLQHRAAVRAGRQSVRRYARQLPLLLRAEDDVHQVLERVHHLSRRLRHARRSVRGADAHPDRQDLSVPGRSCSAATTGPGSIRWLQSRVLGEGKISPGDLDLMLLTDDPQEAAHAVIEAWESQQRQIIAERQRDNGEARRRETRPTARAAASRRRDTATASARRPPDRRREQKRAAEERENAGVKHTSREKSKYPARPAHRSDADRRHRDAPPI